jgi:serine/threonine protein kinase
MGSDGHSPISIDGYQHFARIGIGGFSSVYRAEQNTLGRQVAVKVLHAELDSPEDQRTFERECRALGLLSRHPNIVTVYHDAVTLDGRRCIVMELYHGTVREQLASDGKRPVAEVLRLGVKIGSALQVAHDAGVLHRDVKPHNILLSDYGEPALSDFGISVIDVERSVSAASGLSLAYASPEALDGRRATRASDIYSLGATLFHLLDGEPPFASPRLEATLAKIMTEPPPELGRDDVPSSLCAVLRACLSKSPGDRPDSAADLVAALRGIEAESGFDRTPILQRRRAQPGSVGDRGDALTVGQPGDAVTAAPPDSRGAGAGAGEPEFTDEVSSRSTPSLWPPGWSPWDSADDHTVVRAQRVRPGPPDPVVAATASGAGRHTASLVLTAAAVVVAIGVALILLA